MRRLRHFFTRGEPRPFSTWQIEVTTGCQLGCLMCVKTACKGWTRRDMAADDFRRIVPYLKGVKSVVLEGWGESLLNRNLPEFIALVRKQGAEPGFVTSGKGLGEAYAAELAGAGLGFIGFSLSGALPETHNRIRAGSDLGELLEGLRAVRRCGNEQGGPRIHIVYLMLRDNIEEVPAAVDLAAREGVGEVILINIIQVSDDWQDGQRAFACNEGPSPFQAIIDDAAARARKQGIRLTMPRLSPQGVAVCSENPLENLYISVEGEVSPCVYLHPPVPSPFRRLYCGEEIPTEKASFGNILSDPLERIWSGHAYVDFRGSFLARRRFWEDAYRSLLEMKLPADKPPPPPPGPCEKCYKMMGF